MSQSWAVARVSQCLLDSAMSRTLSQALIPHPDSSLRLPPEGSAAFLVYCHFGGVLRLSVPCFLTPLLSASCTELCPEISFHDEVFGEKFSPEVTQDPKVYRAGRGRRREHFSFEGHGAHGRFR